MARILFLSILLLPLIEIACFVLIGQTIGLWPTLAGVVIAAFAGMLVLRVQGLSMLARMRSSMTTGQLPARALADAMMVGLAGLLLLVPGYFTDLLGLLLLIPPVRGLIYAALRSSVQVVAASSASYSFGETPPAVEDGTIDLDADEWRKR